MIKIFKNALKTDRAFIHYDKIQHISWSRALMEMELKVYSGAGVIIQSVTVPELQDFLNSYVRDWLGIGGFTYE